MVTKNIPPGFEGRPHSQMGGYDRPLETPAAWLAEVELYLEHRKPYVNDWLQNERMYDADPHVTPIDQRNYRLGRAYGLMQSMISQHINARPKLFVNDLTGEAPDEADLYQHLTNADWTFQDDAYAESTLAAFDMGLYGFGATMTVYETEFEAAAKRREERNAQTEQAQRQGSVEELGDIRVEEALTQSAPEHEPTYERDSRLLRERVSTIRVSPWDILMDPTARRYSELRWIGRRIELPKSDLADGPYNSGQVNKVAYSLGEHERYWPKDKKRKERLSTRFQNQVDNWATIYEIWDIVNQRIVVISPSNLDAFLRNDENPYLLPHPYQIESWTARGEYLLPRSDVSAVRNYLDEEETLRSKTRKAFEREREDVFFASRELNLGNDEFTAFTLPNGSRVVPLSCGADEMRNGILPVPTTPKTPDSMQHLAGIKSEIYDTLGVGPNQLGQGLKSETSATEAANVQRYVNAKAAFRAEAINRLVESIAFARLSLMAQFYEERHIVQLAGRGGAKDWAGLRFENGDIQYRFAVRIDPGSMNPQDDMQKAATFQEMLQMALTVPALSQLFNIPNILASWLESRGIRDLSRYLNVQAKNPKELADEFKQSFAQNPTNPYDQQKQSQQGVGNTTHTPTTEAGFNQGQGGQL